MVEVGQKVTWRVWDGSYAVATVVYAGRDGRVHLRASDGHVDFHDRLPKGAEIVLTDAEAQQAIEDARQDRLCGMCGMRVAAKGHTACSTCA